MENRANYLWIGIFVFGVFFASLFVLIFMSGFSHKEEFKLYQIYTKESISGLGIKAPVRLLGVEVGSVEDTSIDAQNGIGVKILIKVKANTPIYESTYATLQLQGITGLKYIELKSDESTSVPLQTSDENIAIIKTKESFLATIDKQSDKLFDLLDYTNQSARMILSDENIKNFSILLKNSASASAFFSQTLRDLSLASSKVAKAADSVYLASNDFSELSQKGSLALNNLDSNLNNSLALLESLLIRLNALSANLEQNPSDLLFKSTQKKLAPGE
ncbi:MCE family protein [Campylobacter sp. MIT 12-8780]|uniref:MlaD family protein n=1 Tax=unclassified Campylobacter TaxID=2593542 RepID=UPI00115E6B15|nr:MULTISPECIES: MlaD family protein [unclassified Campylobacter]NDJ27208.1 MCE family protein [Campylobacter sp. MIT 19-121]TQR41497.1 MCE family protein [Campylobacter sp. MIT 12-8780]